MADTISPERRSANMAAIRNRDTKPEVYIRKLLFARGYRYRKNYAGVPGHPDLYLAKYHAAVFVHGCYWHRHAGCTLCYTPKSRVDFWTAKFAENVARDAAVKAALREQNIRCLIVWECIIRKMRKDEALETAVIDRICAFLQSDLPYLEIGLEQTAALQDAAPLP